MPDFKPAPSRPGPKTQESGFSWVFDETTALGTGVRGHRLRIRALIHQLARKARAARKREPYA